jgi:hypothetical protein
MADVDIFDEAAKPQGDIFDEAAKPDPLKTGEGMVAPPRQQPVPKELQRDINLQNMGEEYNKRKSTAELAVGDVKAGNYTRGAHRVASQTAAGLAPLAVTAAPATLVGGLIGGTAGGYGAHKGAEYLGATPDQADLAGDVGGLIGGYAGAKLPEAPEMFRSYARGPSKSEPIELNPMTAAKRQLEARIPMDEPVTAKGEMNTDIQKEQGKRAAAKSEMDTDIQSEQQKRAAAKEQMDHEIEVKKMERAAAHDEMTHEIEMEKMKRAGAHEDMQNDIQKEQQKRAAAHEEMQADIQGEQIKRAGAHEEMQNDRAAKDAQNAKHLEVIEKARQRELAANERFKLQHAQALNSRTDVPPALPKDDPAYIPTQDEFLHIPEPLPLRPGAAIGDLFSVPREQLVPGARARNPSAAETLQRLGQSLLFTPREGTGYPGPRQEYAPAEPNMQQGGNPPYYSVQGYPEAEQKFGSRSREELATKTSTPQEQAQALRTDNQKLEAQLRSRKGSTAERAQAQARLKQNNQLITELESNGK